MSSTLVLHYLLLIGAIVAAVHCAASEGTGKQNCSTTCSGSSCMTVCTRGKRHVLEQFNSGTEAAKEGRVKREGGNMNCENKCEKGVCQLICEEQGGSGRKRREAEVVEGNGNETLATEQKPDNGTALATEQKPDNGTDVATEQKPDNGTALATEKKPDNGTDVATEQKQDNGTALATEQKPDNGTDVRVKREGGNMNCENKCKDGVCQLICDKKEGGRVKREGDMNCRNDCKDGVCQLICEKQSGSGRKRRDATNKLCVGNVCYTQTAPGGRRKRASTALKRVKRDCSFSCINSSCMYICPKSCNGQCICKQQNASCNMVNDRNGN